MNERYETLCRKLKSSVLSEEPNTLSSGLYAVVGNLEAYREGYDLEVWVHFPCDPWRIKDILNAIDCSDNQYYIDKVMYFPQGKIMSIGSSTYDLDKLNRIAKILLKLNDNYIQMIDAYYEYVDTQDVETIILNVADFHIHLYDWLHTPEEYARCVFYNYGLAKSFEQKPLEFFRYCRTSDFANLIKPEDSYDIRKALTIRQDFLEHHKLSDIPDDKLSLIFNFEKYGKMLLVTEKCVKLTKYGVIEYRRYDDSITPEKKDRKKAILFA